jgi:hypothetical protein
VASRRATNSATIARPAARLPVASQAIRSATDIERADIDRVEHADETRRISAFATGCRLAGAGRGFPQTVFKTLVRPAKPASRGRTFAAWCKAGDCRGPFLQEDERKPVVSADTGSGRSSRAYRLMSMATRDAKSLNMNPAEYPS